MYDTQWQKIILSLAHLPEFAHCIMTTKSANEADDKSILSDKMLIIHTLFVEEPVKLNASFVDKFCHQLALLSDDIFDKEFWWRWYYQRVRESGHQPSGTSLAKEWDEKNLLIQTWNPGPIFECLPLHSATCTMIFILSWQILTFFLSVS